MAQDPYLSPVKEFNLSLTKTDKEGMKHQNKRWIKYLDIDKDQLQSAAPEGEDLLVWSLKNNHVDETAYTRWASEYFKVPAIKAEFFSMAIDFSLVKKYQNIYTWNSYLYPIYQWENTLYIACLQPFNLPTDLNICFVISPITALESAWEKHSSEPLINQFSPPMEPRPLPQEESKSPSMPDIKPKVEAQNNETKEQQTSSLDGLDFSALENQTSFYDVPEGPVDDSTSEEVITQTKIEVPINNATSATSASQKNHDAMTTKAQENSSQLEPVAPVIDADSFSLDLETENQPKNSKPILSDHAMLNPTHNSLPRKPAGAEAPIFNDSLSMNLPPS